MPCRVIREGWLDSRKIAELEDCSENFFLRLCLKADDYGFYSGDPIMLKSYLYPLKPTVRTTDISHWIAACVKAGLIACHKSPRQGQVLQILNFNQRLRKMRPSQWSEGIDALQVSDKCQTSVSQVSDTCTQPSVSVSVSDSLKNASEKQDARGACTSFRKVYPDKFSAISPETDRELTRAIQRDGAEKVIAGARAYAEFLSRCPDYDFTMQAYNFLSKSAYTRDWQAEETKWTRRQQQAVNAQPAPSTDPAHVRWSSKNDN